MPMNRRQAETCGIVMNEKVARLVIAVLICETGRVHSLCLGILGAAPQHNLMPCLYRCGYELPARWPECFPALGSSSFSRTIQWVHGKLEPSASGVESDALESSILCAPLDISRGGTHVEAMGRKLDALDRCSIRLFRLFQGRYDLSCS